jgi:hypothetical protein
MTTPPACIMDASCNFIYTEHVGIHPKVNQTVQVPCNRHKYHMHYNYTHNNWEWYDNNDCPLCPPRASANVMDVLTEEQLRMLFTGCTIRLNSNTSWPTFEEDSTAIHDLNSSIERMKERLTICTKLNELLETRMKIRKALDTRVNKK